MHRLITTAVLALSLSGCDALRMAAPVALAGTEAVLRHEYSDDPAALARALTLLEALRAAAAAAEEAAQRAEEASDPEEAAAAHEDCATANAVVAELQREVGAAVKLGR
jgi:precorrin-6B methylase 1